MVSLYNEGRLRNEGRDVELEASADSTPLRPKVAMASTNHFASSPVNPLQSGAVHTPVVVGQKRRLESHPGGDEDDTASGVKIKPGHIDDIAEIVVSDDEEEKDVLEALKRESDVTFETPKDSASERPIISSRPEQGYPYVHGEHFDPPSSSLSPSIDSYYSVNAFSPSSSSSNSALPSDSPFDFSWVANEFISSSRKAHVILSSQTSEDFNNDVTKKILDSLLYDLGKAAAIRCTPLNGSNSNAPLSKVQTRQYVDSLFNEWCANFAHMNALEKLELNYTPEKKMSFKVYMRARLSNAFSSVRRIKSKPGRQNQR